jgi:hypothetical protein
MEDWNEFMAKWWHLIRAKTKDEFNKFWSEFKADDTILENCKDYVFDT